MGQRAVSQYTDYVRYTEYNLVSTIALAISLVTLNHFGGLDEAYCL